MKVVSICLIQDVQIAQISKEVIRLEQKVFQYAQQNFFARQDEISQEDESFQEDVFRGFHAYMGMESKY